MSNGEDGVLLKDGLNIPVGNGEDGTLLEGGLDSVLDEMVRPHIHRRRRFVKQKYTIPKIKKYFFFSLICRVSLMPKTWFSLS